MLSEKDWHARFTQQAEWTKDIREYLLAKANFHQAKQILDVGCGTGALVQKIKEPGKVHGLDINIDRLFFAKQIHHNTPFIGGDAHHLPFRTDTFDLIYCHFLLLWVDDPVKVLSEMVRVGKPGGHLLILAEPDYGGRIDHPAIFQPLGQAQTDGLKLQGADPHTGRHLREWLHAVGLIDIEVGILDGQWRNPPTKADWELEWQVLEYDLADRVSVDEITQYKKLDWDAWEEGSRVLYVPTFYAIGIIP